MIKLVTAGDTPRLRKIRKDAPRDLVTIVEKAIEKEPARRYQTAGALADDLQRFIDGRPITARPVGKFERAIKWVRRNPVVTGAAIIVLFALTLGTSVSYLKYLEAERQKGVAEVNQHEAEMHQGEAEKQTALAQNREREARKETEKAKKARDFLVSIFQISERDVHGGNITARQILVDAEKRISLEFADQPELRGELLAAIGVVKRSIARQVPQAMILSVSGGVKLQSATGVARLAVPQTLVNLDDTLSLSADGQVQMVFLSDFHKERIRPGHDVTIDVKGCEPADAVLERDESILLPFSRLPKATFYIGWDGKKPGVMTEIMEDFEMGQHLVTQGQWEVVMGNNPSFFSRKGPARGRVLDISDEELKLFPVDNVSWDDTQEFIKRLNQRERGHGYLYRLPTEAEWEYACRNGAISNDECSFHFYFDKPTNQLSSDLANFDGNFPAGNAAKGPFHWRTTRVGAYPSNKLGLCDMHGNVWQWCDHNHADGPARWARGGTWGSQGDNCRASTRGSIHPSYRDSSRGFRLVRVSTRDRS
jgi:formylglycine-generating enzyme required for sulfatase activity